MMAREREREREVLWRLTGMLRPPKVPLTCYFFWRVACLSICHQTSGSVLSMRPRTAEDLSGAKDQLETRRHATYDNQAIAIGRERGSHPAVPTGRLKGRGSSHRKTCPHKVGTAYSVHSWAAKLYTLLSNSHWGPLQFCTPK